MDKKNLIAITNKAKKLKSLLEQQYKLEQLVIFGSQIKNKAHAESDVDIAIISNDFGHDYWRETSQVQKLANKIDSRFEIHLFNQYDFNDPFNPLVSEVKNHQLSI